MYKYLLLLLMIFSCKKDDTNTIQSNNELVDSKWVLVSVYYNYALINKSDTINFIDERTYTIGLDNTTYTYYLYNTPASSTLTLNTFMPINGLSVTASNFNAESFNKTAKGNSIQLVFVNRYNTAEEYISTLRKL